MLLLVELQAKPSKNIELERVLSDLVYLSGKEPGNLAYAAHRRQDNPGCYVLYELYENRAAWETHLGLEAVQQALQQFESLLAGRPKLTFCDTVALSGIASAK